MTDKPLDCAGTTGPVGKHDFVDDRCRVCGAAFVVMGDRFLTGICSPECRDISGEMRTAQELIEEELRNDPEFAEIHRRQMEIDAAPRPDIVRPGADSCAPVAPVVDGMPSREELLKQNCGLTNQQLVDQIASAILLATKSLIDLARRTAPLARDWNGEEALNDFADIIERLNK